MHLPPPTPLINQPLYFNGKKGNSRPTKREIESWHKQLEELQRGLSLTLIGLEAVNLTAEQRTAFNKNYGEYVEEIARLKLKILNPQKYGPKN